MSTTRKDTSSTSEAASSSSAEGVGQETSERARRFRPLSAMRLIERQLSGVAQHVAMVLARMTRAERGEVAIKLDELTAVTGWSQPTLIRALRQIEAAGLLEKKRRGSVANVYRWKEAAYVDPPVAERAQNPVFAYMRQGAAWCMLRPWRRRSPYPA
jgi:hypothetical protein